MGSSREQEEDAENAEPDERKDVDGEACSAQAETPRWEVALVTDALGQEGCNADDVAGYEGDVAD